MCINILVVGIIVSCLKYKGVIFYIEYVVMVYKILILVVEVVVIDWDKFNFSE